MKRKEVDDVLGGDQTWKDADSTTSKPFPPPFSFVISCLNMRQVACPKCDHERAYFYQLQIRSADEPMTTCMSTLDVLKVVSNMAWYMMQFTGKRP